MAKQQPVASSRSASKRETPRRSNSGTSQKGHDGEVPSSEKELARYLEQRIKPGLNSGAIPMLAWSIAKQIVRGEYADGSSAEDAEVDLEHNGGTDVDDSGETEVETDAGADVEESAEADVEDSAEADADDEEDAEDDAQVDDAEADDVEDSAEADDVEDDAEADEVEDSAESEALPDLESLHALQAQLGEDWIVRYSVQGDDSWLIAEKEDGSQYLEAATGSVLAEVVGLLNERGARST